MSREAVCGDVYKDPDGVLLKVTCTFRGLVNSHTLSECAWHEGKLYEVPRGNGVSFPGRPGLIVSPDLQKVDIPEELIVNAWLPALPWIEVLAGE